MSVYRKFLVALATALATLAIVIADGDVSTVEWILVALDVLGAVGVYAVPNAAHPSA